MALLGIKDRYLKCLRDNRLLGYSRHGDKYWYTQVDVDRFLSLNVTALLSGVIFEMSRIL